ncbi:predicted protein [Postia placenta Mad-698-R]|uniref:Uncharacterized protein n=1 Tax=Postia placenta MAD-698-R-SB12 TaxID=670580 RepID=A0A1X6N024_9APHY|nr:hypothetical protein POSPLADRAFT_1144532 [Postia placenta MAD-698-R-SB12]EED79471.1 predicted protein [Postia placenta Mad-698-R]OSX61840.1 hypothetical protein POSPLADRAFT_1144532 [Postia placenta MAD-698-R-SB12]
MVKRNAPAKNGSRRVPQIDKDIKRWEVQIPKPENAPMEMDHGLERYIEHSRVNRGLRMQWYPHSDRGRSQRGEYSMVFNVTRNTINVGLHHREVEPWDCHSRVIHLRASQCRLAESERTFAGLGSASATEAVNTIEMMVTWWSAVPPLQVSLTMTPPKSFSRRRVIRLEQVEACHRQVLHVPARNKLQEPFMGHAEPAAMQRAWDQGHAPGSVQALLGTL